MRYYRIIFFVANSPLERAEESKESKGMDVVANS